MSSDEQREPDEEPPPAPSPPGSDVAADGVGGVAAAPSAASPEPESPGVEPVEPEAPAGPDVPVIAAVAPAPVVDATAAADASAPVFRPSYAFLAIVTALSLAADVGTKLWAKFHFEADGAPQQVVLIDQLFSKVNLHFIYAKNPAGAWGLALGLPEVVRRPFFLIVSVAAIVFIISLYRKLGPRQRALKWGLPLVLGGALGNLIDRILYGKVIDFIDVFFTRAPPERDWHWPTFNVADIAIVVGVLLMAIDMFTSRKKRSKKPAADTPPQSGHGGSLPSEAVKP